VVAMPRGKVLTELQTGRQMRWIVKGLPDDWRSDYQAGSGVTRMDATAATLEDIFVATSDLTAVRPPEAEDVSQQDNFDEPSEVA